MKEPWTEYVNLERRIVAPRHLEARVLSAVRAAGARAPRPHRAVWFAPAAVALAALLIAVMWPERRETPEQPPIAATPIAVTPLPHAVASQPPVLPAVGTREARIHPDVVAQHDDLTGVLVMLDAAPPLSSEAVQMVRLRVRRDALQTLGLAVLEPDAGGTVELAVLVGEDGLPRDIRQIRNSQEER